MASPQWWVASERERGWLPLGVDPQLQPGGMWPNEAVAMARWSHSHSGLRPLRHHDRSLPLYKPSQNQVLAPLQEASVPRLGLLEASPHSRHQMVQAREEQAEHTGPEKTDSPERALSRSQGSFP